MKYLFPFLISFSLTIIFIIAGILLGKKIPWKGRTSLRHASGRKSFRLGGVAMMLAFFAAIFLDKNLVMDASFYGITAASLILLIVGVWDDLQEISWKLQFAGQILAAVVVFISGIRIYYISNPLTGSITHFDSLVGIVFSAALVILWIVLMMNSINWFDGVDGLSGGVAFIGAVTIFLLSLKPEVNQPPMAIISVAFAGVTLGFLLFNFYPSHVMAGTVGSMFIGFILAVMAIFAGTKIATSVLVLSFPLADSLRVIWERWRNSNSIFNPDERHLHHALVRRGWSPYKVACYIYSATLFLAIIALNTRMIGKSVTLAIVFLVMAVFLFLTPKKS